MENNLCNYANYEVFLGEPGEPDEPHFAPYNDSFSCTRVSKLTQSILGVTADYDIANIVEIYKERCNDIKAVNAIAAKILKDLDGTESQAKRQTILRDPIMFESVDQPEDTVTIDTASLWQQKKGFNPDVDYGKEVARIGDKTQHCIIRLYLGVSIDTPNEKLDELIANRIRGFEISPSVSFLKRFGFNESRIGIIVLNSKFKPSE